MRITADDRGKLGTDVSADVVYEVFDAGRVKQGDLVEHSFDITNSSDQTVVFGPPTTDTGCCTTVAIDKSTIDRGESAALKVVFDSTRQPGDFTAEFTLPVVSPSPSARVFRLSAKVSEDIVWHPRQLELRPGKVSKLTLRSHRKEILKIKSVGSELVKLDVVARDVQSHEIVYDVRLDDSVELTAKPTVGVVKIVLDDPNVKDLLVAALILPGKLK